MLVNLLFVLEFLVPIDLLSLEDNFRRQKPLRIPRLGPDRYFSGKKTKQTQDAALEEAKTDLDPQDVAVNMVRRGSSGCYITRAKSKLLSCCACASPKTSKLNQARKYRTNRSNRWKRLAVIRLVVVGNGPLRLKSVSRCGALSCRCPMPGRLKCRNGIGITNRRGIACHVENTVSVFFLIRTQ